MSDYTRLNAYTAMCIWEAVTEAAANKQRAARTKARTALLEAGLDVPVGLEADGIDALLERKESRGTHELRDHCLVVATALNAVWNTVNVAVPDYEGLEPFDWAFVPAFLMRCLMDDADVSNIAEERMIDYAQGVVSEAEAFRARAAAKVAQ